MYVKEVDNLIIYVPRAYREKCCNFNFVTFCNGHKTSPPAGLRPIIWLHEAATHCDDRRKNDNKTISDIFVDVYNRSG